MCLSHEQEGGEGKNCNVGGGWPKKDEGEGGEVRQMGRRRDSVGG